MPKPLCEHVLCHAAEYEDEDYYRSMTIAQLQDGQQMEAEIYVWVESKRYAAVSVTASGWCTVA